jgi:CheY-like chemotaxis protein
LLTREHSGQKETYENDAKRSNAIPSYKVLIADDEYLIRWSLSHALAREGYEVICVENGREAIEAVRIQHFDFIITDLIMPESDGWEVLETIQQSQLQPLPRVIIITAHGKDETKRAALEKGAWAYIEKPYIIDKIKDILKGNFTRLDDLNSR